MGANVSSSGNPTLDKNLACINRYNPKLAQDLLNLSELQNKVEMLQTEANEPNLAYNWVPLHSSKGAEIEAKEIFSNTQNTKISMHVIYGMGLGYLFDVFCQNSKGLVFLIEPNLEILRVTLELVDLSQQLCQPNVFVFSDIPSFKQIFVQRYEYNCDVAFKVLNSYRQLDENGVQEIFKQVEIIAGICMTDYNTLKKDGLRSIYMMFDNLPYTLDGVPLKEFENIYKGRTALLVSAGPSLDLNIETIKQNRDKFIIFCVGTAFKALARNAIAPDFLTVIEVNDCSEQVKGFDLSQINMILEPYTNTAFYKRESKRKILFPTNASHANNTWARLTGTDISQYSSKGTVAYASLVAAKSFGCSKMILIGQDLAYVNNQCYSKDSPYSDLVFEVNPQTGKPEFKIRNYERYIKSLFKEGVDTEEPFYREFADNKVKNLNDTLYFVKGVSGEMIPTQASYATFIEHFREFARQNKDLTLINSSMIGAQIDGFENIPLEEAIKNTDIISSFDFERTFKFDKKLIVQNLEKEKQNLQGILREFAQAKDYIFKYEREFNRRKIVTDEAKKFFKQSLDIYSKINDEHYNKEPLFQMLAVNETLEVKSVILQTETLDNERINLISGLLRTYYTEVEKKVLDIINTIDSKKGIINESIDSKS